MNPQNQNHAINAPILGIETSCDETATAVIHNGRLLASVVSSQAVHSEWGGVVPELASREHMRNLVPLVDETLAQAGIGYSDLGGIAATSGPGLVGALVVGLTFGRSLAAGLQIPFMPVNHLEGHIWAPLLEDNTLQGPFICLLVSGGHTLLIYVEKFGQYRILGQSVDDAAGEAFDKVAKLLNLGYPGGPIIDRLAREGDPTWHRFPKVGPKGDTLNTSFSGTKTAVLYKVQQMSAAELDAHRADVCAAFQYTVVDGLVTRTKRVIRQTGCRALSIGGGVAANQGLKDALRRAYRGAGVKLIFPALEYCGDNAAMIALVGERWLKSGEPSPYPEAPVPNLRLQVQEDLLESVDVPS
jgi:N6-L-threonylcarbamoyladenine synthase